MYFTVLLQALSNILLCVYNNVLQCLVTGFVLHIVVCVCI